LARFSFSIPRYRAARKLRQTPALHLAKTSALAAPRYFPRQGVHPNGSTHLSEPAQSRNLETHIELRLNAASGLTAEVDIAE
jgi:hypothetical protein